MTAASAIIVDVGRPSRRLDPRLSRPRALEPVEDAERPVLEWILHALKSRGVADVTYVGGYHIEKVIERFPELRFRYHARRDSEGEVGALMLCAPAAGDCLILRASTLILPDALERLPAAPVVAGTYRSEGGAAPAGVFRLGAAASALAFEAGRALAASRPAAGLEALVGRLGELGMAATEADLDGLAAPVFDRGALARTVFNGKAQTLDNLAPLSHSAIVLERARVSVAAWRADAAAVVAGLGARFGGRPVVVRSSATAEDGLAASDAGRFRSLLGVESGDPKALAEAIEAVVASYGTGGREIAPADEILVQPHVEDLAVSGVLLTRDGRSGAPYYVLNQDRDSGRSDLVTSGGEGRLETRVVAWSGVDEAALPEDSRQVIRLGAELQRLTRLDALDVEFGIDRSGRCHLFQARPLALAAERPGPGDEDVLGALADARAFVAGLMRPRPGLLGATTLLGAMPDWNPAEMIGTAPRPLALSLYQALIGDEAWAAARARLGYRDVRPEPLILAVAGRPYVDVRASLNSFLPAALDEGVAERWTDACLERLREYPELHDKLEFELAVTCLSPAWPAQRERLARAGLDEAEIGHVRDGLQDLTEAVIGGGGAPTDPQTAALERLAERRRQWLADPADDVPSLARRARHLLEDCRRLGVVPFAVLARRAFVAMDLLKGLCAAGAIDAAAYEAVLEAVPTVAGRLRDDVAGLAEGRASLDSLIDRYGHLRPNSYEITAPNYAADPDQYFRAPAGEAAPARPTRDVLEILAPRRAAIDKAFAEVGLALGVEDLARFAAHSIAGREQAKFTFMRNVNDALEAIAALGERLDLDRAQMALLPVAEIVRLATDSVSDGSRGHLRRLAGLNQKRWELTCALSLPDLIRTPEEVLAFRLESWRANFITRRRVVAPAVWLDEAARGPALDGAIVILRAADPGYDWIFGHRIAGMITQYGGAASHMAIRAAEFGLPAAIGCGQARVEGLRGAARVELDCEREIVRAVA